jgi:hypothetical protein
VPSPFPRGGPRSGARREQTGHDDLNTTEQALKVDLQAFSDPQTYSRRRQETDRFWQQQEQNRAG